MRPLNLHKIATLALGGAYLASTYVVQVIIYFYRTAIIYNVRAREEEYRLCREHEGDDE